MSNQKIRLGTRGSQLAIWQSNWVASQIRKCDIDVELVTIKTSGDTQTGPLSQIGGQGLFTKRLQQALLANEIDLAVHSLKDLPTDDVEGLTIAAIPVRANPHDALVSNSVSDWQSLPKNATIGTGSVRRAAQLRHLRPDLNVIDIRGNVDTRLAKLDANEYDAIILACAGLQRLSLADRISYEFTNTELAPAVGQGALGLETRTGDDTLHSIVTTLNDTESFAAATSERALLKCLFAGCLAPVAAISKCDNQTLQLTGFVLSRDGTQKITATSESPLDEPIELGNRVAKLLIEQGADKLLSGV